MFRATGFDFLVDEFLSQSTLVPHKVWRKGERKSAKRIHKWSGFTMVASEADMDDVPQQIADAMNFLTTNHEELSKLQNFPGAETVSLDFGIEDRDVGVQCDYFPPELLRLAGNLGIGIEITRY
jgi:hypothetical protein